jgi:hypothetical protein
MTNTVSVSFLPADQKVAYRTDEVGFLSDLAEVASTYNVLRIGRFIPGDSAQFAAAYVLRLIRDEYVVHTMVRNDALPGPVSWSFYAGHYTHDFKRAVEILNER